MLSLLETSLGVFTRHICQIYLISQIKKYYLKYKFMKMDQFIIFLKLK